MSRYQPPAPKGPSPIWRGIGCLLMFVFTIGGYFTTGWLIQAYQAGSFPGVPIVRLPGILQVGPFVVPASGVVIPAVIINPAQLLVTVVVMIVMFSILTVAWGIMNPVKLGPMDAPPSNRKVDHSKNR